MPRLALGCTFETDIHGTPVDDTETQPDWDPDPEPDWDPLNATAKNAGVLTWQSLWLTDPNKLAAADRRQKAEPTPEKQTKATSVKKEMLKRRIFLGENGERVRLLFF